MNDNIIPPIQNIPATRIPTRILKLLPIGAIIILFSGLGIWYFLSSFHKTPVANPQSNVGEPEKVTGVDEIKLTPIIEIQPGKPLGFRALLQEKNGQTVNLFISLDQLFAENASLVQNASFPAQIRAGSCPQPGGTKFNLKPITNGSSNTNLDINFDQLKQAGPLSVAVENPASQSGVFISCGNLK